MAFCIKIYAMKTFFLTSILILTSHASLVHATEAFSTEQPSHPTHISSLAATCAACHGTQGNSIHATPILAGLDSGYFMTQMFAFKKGERSATVMHQHAKGLTEEEISALAHYFSIQKRVNTTSLVPQRLESTHE
ncbi:MAG: c-type cytochrome [Methylophilus sp.]|nr:c-type cytochrome [Methylophilus sp.]